MSKEVSGFRKAAPVLRRAQSALGLILVFVCAVVLSPHDRDGAIIFLGLDNLSDIVRSVSIVGLIGLSMTLVILTAGIDLSVGSIMALSTCVLATLLTKKDWAGMAYLPHAAIAIAAALAACSAVGTVTGVVISRIGVPPFIVTLAGMLGVRGLAKLITGNFTKDMGFGNDLPAVFTARVSAKPAMLLTYAIFAGAFALLLGKTVFGRYVRAVGDNEKASRYSGLPIARIKICVYTLSGLMCGVAGILYAAQTHMGDPNAGYGYELDAIAAVVIGGTSLAGGKGSVVGTIIGTLIVGMLANILGLMGVDSNVQQIIKAVIIILAVWLQKQDKAE